MIDTPDLDKEPEIYNFRCNATWHANAYAYWLESFLNHGNPIELVPKDQASRFIVGESAVSVWSECVLLECCAMCIHYVRESGHLTLETCFECENISVSRWGHTHQYYDSYEGGLCEDCHQEYVDEGAIEMCDDCESWFVSDEGRCCTPRLIHSYSHKPEPQFKPALPNTVAVGYSERRRYGRTPTKWRDYRTREIIENATLARYGVELEFEIHNNTDRDIAQYIREYDPSETTVVAKYDGSLNYGIELNFHPRSLESWADYALELDKFLQGLIDRGCRADKERSTGIHIHSNRMAYDSPSHVWRVLKLVGDHEDEVIEFARRRSSYASFENIKENALMLAFRKYYGDHFDAVNATGHTLEFRVFRSSLRAGRVLANIQLIDSINEFTRFMTVKDIGGGALSWIKLTEFLESDNKYALASHAMAGGKFYNSVTLTTEDEE